jgi:hypothetical protein
MSNMAAGIPIGLAMGLAAGMQAGKKKARENLQQFMIERGVEIRDADGTVLTVEEVLQQIDLREDAKVNLRRALFIAGVLIFVALTALYLFTRLCCMNPFLK